ncbi:hypothetical protein [Thermogutta terrifontis]|nr:hypothetical protein [Thermogutta terrifontis]
MQQLPNAMVVLSSEQLWPNILGLVHWHKHEGGVKDLCIYYTNNPVRSKQPAERFAAFAKKVFPPIHVHLPEAPGGTLPQDVLGQILAWQKQLPARRWIINATGGLKLMFYGAVQAKELPNTEVVYGELSGEWFRWRKTAHGEQLESLSIDRAETDYIPVRYLVQAQSGVAFNRTWQCQKPEPLPVAQVVQDGIETGWDWPRMFARIGRPNEGQAGFLFEKFVAAVLLEMGIPQVDVNAKLGEGNGQSVQEIDVIANYRGRILIFDCKLRVESEEGRRVEPLAVQIRQAAAIRRDIGGIGAMLLMIRPGRAFREQEKLLARELGVDILDSAATLNFFRELARFCGLPGELPASLQKAQDLLDGAKSQGYQEALAKSSFLGATPGAEPRGVLIRLESHLNKYMEETAQDWAVYQMGRHIYLYYKIPPNVPAAVCLNRWQQICDEVAEIKPLWTAKGGKVALARLIPKVDTDQLRMFLGRHRGQKLLQ